MKSRPSVRSTKLPKFKETVQGRGNNLPVLVLTALGLPVNIPIMEMAQRSCPGF